MKLFTTKQIIGVGLGLLWSLLYSALFTNLPIIQKLELDLQDGLTRLYKPGSPPNEILLLKINQSGLSGYDLHNLSKLNIFYATLLQSLIQHGANVVVLNLPEQIKQYIDTDTNPRLELPFQESIRHYSSQIVLVTRPTSLPSGTPAINTYNNLLPFDDEKTSSSIVPEQIISYFRYDPDPRNVTSPARRLILSESFVFEDDPNLNETHQVSTVTQLAIEKFSKTSNQVKALEKLFHSKTLSSLQTNFWEPIHSFPRVTFQFQCSVSPVEVEQCRGSFDPQSLPTLRNKLVLVDLPEGKTAENFSIKTPYGGMSIAEVQANQIASVMTRSFRTMAPEWSDYLITAIGVVFMSLYVMSRFKTSGKQLIQILDIWFLLGLIGFYITLSLLFFWQGFILPLSVPLIGWIVTGAMVITYLLYMQSVQQRQRLAERQAILLQARKLLLRVATDIHDGPLQDLKLVMDGIELLNLHHPSSRIVPLLERLESVGLSLRDQLSNTRIIAEKLEITPELQFGLAYGLHQWLQFLASTGKLSLSVREHLQSLREPKHVSAWIDAREDIFCFFREAITNIIHHVQPPNGTATEVSIHLSQAGKHCRLMIENNGTSLTKSFTNITLKQGGYGTKLMATIAAELPNGVWQRIPLEQGGMRVSLEWTMDAF